MPAQKRPASPSPSLSPPPAATAPAPAGTNGHAPPPPPPAVDVELTPQGEEEKPAPKAEEEEEAAAVTPLVQYDSDKEGSSSSSPSSPTAADQEEFILVKLADIRKEVQCPICLGIIRKTRTVMECLHRFCRQCIDKSMRLGNNECPACRTHCASRRSLRDDPNYDALIAALYPDIDEYEEEELAFHEEERTRNRQIQASIAETYRRQTEALGRKRSSAKATAAAFVRKSQRNFRNNGLRTGGRSGGRETVLIGSDEDDGDEEDEEDEQDANGNEGGKYSSAEECSPESRHKKRKRLPESCTSPAVTAGNSVMDCEENEELETGRENRKTPPLQSSHIEKLAWGKGGVRSQTRHGGASTLRYNKGGRLSKLAELLRSSDSKDNEVNVHLTLQPMDEGSVPCLEEPHIYCCSSVSIGHLCQFIANKTSAQVEKVEILARKSIEKPLPIAADSGLEKPHIDLSLELQILGVKESLAGLCDSFTGQGDLVLLYRVKV